MLASITITVLVLPAVAVLLLNTVFTGGYAGRVPGGSDAMGLVVPLLASAIGALLLLVAAWVCAARGGLAWIGVATGLSAWPTAILASLVTFGVGLAAVGVLVAWMERMGAWVPAAGLVCGGLAPVLLGLVLLAAAWAPADSLSGTPLPPLVGVFLAAVAVAGLGCGLFATHKSAQRANANAASVRASNLARDAEWARKRARTPIEALREDYSEMNADSPLWVIIASLPDTNDDTCRAFIINRAMQVPDLDAQLSRTLTDDHPRYRHGCADLIRFVHGSQARPVWADPLAKSIAVTAAQVRASAGWLTPDAFSNPDPIGHLTALADAARRLRDHEPLASALADLAQAVQEQPDGPARQLALDALRGPATGDPAISTPPPAQ